jgi:2-oxoglutarate ferredoxin oxidoreductase subunit delta
MSGKLIQMTRKKTEAAKSKKTEPKVSFYPGWCKRCGICAAFCPKDALETDEWGYPFLAHPEKCIRCRLCEKLCPDFAVSVGEEAPPNVAHRAGAGPSPGRQGSPVSPNHSPERLAPQPQSSEEHDA